jgi:hypothetical protein
MIGEIQRQALLETSKLKLAARSRLLEGDKDARYEAAVLFHAAARAERRALHAMDRPSAEARLASAIEQCGCLIDGRDPTAVLEASWGEVLDASARVNDETARAMRARIDPDRAALVAEYARVLAKLPALKAWIESAGPAAATPALRREADRFLAVFAGDARIWGLRATLDLGTEDLDAAWSAVRRALSLAPESSSLKQAELDLMPRFLPAAEVSSQLDAVYADIQSGNADTDICFGFLSAALQLAERGGPRDKLVRQALDAATAGWGLPPLWPLDRKMFHAMQLGLREVVAGRRPNLGVLYRSGLGTWAVGSGEDADPVAIVLRRMRPIRHLQAA